MVIKSITIQNYESHENTTIDFSSGLNVIVGSSDQGKSAILRAFNWVFFNKPAGDAFRSKWGGETAVTVETDETTITRVKGKENKYILQKPNEKPMVFKSFGANVPIEISQDINFSSINIQTQFDSHFLLPPISPGEVARQINQYVNLEIIDKALFNINSKLRGLVQCSTSIQTGISALQTDISNYSHLEKAEEFLAKLEKTEIKINSINNNYCHLDALITAMEVIYEEIENYKDIKEKEKKIARLNNTFSYISQIKENYGRINSLVEKYKDVKRRSVYGDWRGRENYLGSLLKLNEEIKEIGNSISSISKTINSILMVENEIKYNTANIKKKEKEFEKMMPIGSNCPLCGQKIK